MTTIQLDADVDDLFGYEGGETQEKIIVDVTATKIYLEDAFKCKVSHILVGKWVYYILHDVDGKQAEAIMELLGMFTLFNATSPAKPK